ncbi:HAMP domain-containing sensor histidine kinase [Paenibacillus qinlingensis]|uniref:histidine kinase n=1 Tax=Paenibacillus qinlingensis TaxID=1837343 RepID=A0ABU1P100_9BACL|nr:HAMP domain-containing sensor histidine kinase [Paenibacillus qinlingensis]MDR6553419.1 two-component system sensor histidine kinase CssS [Paenibacillus qinlingensis]
MSLRLGQWPLALKLWSAFAALTLLIFTLLAILLPWTLKGFFTEQLYSILLDTQSGLQVEATLAEPRPAFAIPIAPIAQKPIDLTKSQEQPTLGNRVIVVPSGEASGTVNMGAQPGISTSVGTLTAVSTLSAQITAPLESTLTGPSIRHFTISGTQAAEAIAATTATTTTLHSAEPFMAAMEKDALAQLLPVEKYSRNIDNKSIFYVIRKEVTQGTPNFIVSYAWGNYRNDLIMSMFGRLMLLMVGLIVASWLPCLLLARYFTRPLVQMEQHVGRMAKRDWHEPIDTGRRKDEIGRLGKAIEGMRQRLVKQDHAQQFFLQHTSHELKTPVMVIRSYAQSIQDGVFPKGTLSASIGVIMKEGERLEKRIRDLLLLNKLNYFTAKEKPFHPFDIKAVIEDVVERLRYRRPEMDWELQLAPHTLIGDQEQWKIALENMLDNQLRYAETCIRICVKPAPHFEMRMSNDGPLLDQDIADNLFEPFRTGGKGQFGLGLAIVKQIMDHHAMSVRAANENNAVTFTILPADNTVRGTET